MYDDGTEDARLIPELPPLTKEELDDMYEVLSNHVDERPFFVERYDHSDPANPEPDGYRVAVADDQPICFVPRISECEGLDRAIAWAICNAARAIYQLRKEADDGSIRAGC